MKCMKIVILRYFSHYGIMVFIRETAEIGKLRLHRCSLFAKRSVVICHLGSKSNTTLYEV